MPRIQRGIPHHYTGSWNRLMTIWARDPLVVLNIQVTVPRNHIPILSHRKDVSGKGTRTRSSNIRKPTKVVPVPRSKTILSTPYSYWIITGQYEWIHICLPIQWNKKCFIAIEKEEHHGCTPRTILSKRNQTQRSVDWVSNSYEIQADGMGSDREISAYLEPSVRELENKDLRFVKLLYDYHSSFT